MKKRTVIIIVIIVAIACIVAFSPIDDVFIGGTKMIFDIMKQEEQYKEADLSEILNYDDRALYEAMSTRIYDKIDFENFEASVASLNEYEQTFIIVYEFDAEVTNGGLCQYFGNSRGVYGKRVAEELQKIGADEYADIYTYFVKNNKINFKQFENGWDDNWEDAYNKYPYNNFDDKFNELYLKTPLESYLAEYIRANSEFFE